MILMLKLILEYVIIKRKLIGAVCKLFQAVDGVAYTVDIIFHFSDAELLIITMWSRHSFQTECTCNEAMTGHKILLVKLFAY